MNLFLLGNSRVEVDGQPIKLSFKKAYALLFYLAVEGVASRENVVHVLWGNQSEQVAKKNLRNAVYVIRKTLGEDIILSPKRELLKFNNQAAQYIDIKHIEFMSKEVLLSLDKLTFLEGFYVKDSYYFDKWLCEQRFHFNEILVKRLKSLIEEALETKDFNIAETASRKLLQIDEYDEFVYRLLFRALKGQEKYTAIVQTYNELSSLLKKDLMLMPDDETKKIYEEIMMAKSSNVSVKKEKKVYGRVAEMNMLRAGMNDYIANRNGGLYVLHGEFGVGKSTIIDAFYDEISNDHTVFVGRCYKAEVDFPMSPWLALLDELSKDSDCLNQLHGFFEWNGQSPKLYETGNMNSYIVEKTILDMMACLLSKKNIVVVFEDIQWMDSISMKLFVRLLQMDIFVVITVNTDYYPIEHYEDLFSGVTSMHKITVSTFTKLETFELIKMLRAEEIMHMDVLEQIYDESRGNPLYVAEILNAYVSLSEKRPYSSKIDDVMQTRFRMLEEDEQKLLNIASNFYDYFSYEDIKNISRMDELILLEVLSQLVKKHILLEVTRYDNLYFTFSHHALRECIYTSLPLAVRRVYHSKIGQYLEKIVGDKPKLNMLYRLLYNFSNADNPIKELTYRVKFVSDYFNFTHEMFPIMSSDININDEYSDIVDVAGIHDEIVRIRELFQAHKHHLSVDENYELMFNYHKIVGRYYNIQGELSGAIVHMKQLLELAELRGSYGDQLIALLQMIYYYINDLDIRALENALDKAFVLTSHIDQEGLQGVLLRMKGYYHILNGDFDLGIELEKKAIDVFENLSDKKPYVLNLVGAFYYMAEGYRFKGELKKAMELYGHAIDICETNGFKNKLAFIYGSLGQTSYEMTDYDAAEKFLKKSKDLYSHFENRWGKVIFLGYYGLVLMRSGRYDETLNILKEIDKTNNVVFNSYQLALIQRVKAEVCYWLRSNGINNALFKYIDCKNKSYCEIAKDNLGQFNSTYEVRLLEKMNTLCAKCRTEV